MHNEPDETDSASDFEGASYVGEYTGHCNFCNGPMPCHCPEPEGLQESIDRDMENRAKYDDLWDDYGMQP